jgi:hypothetical protein
MLIDIPHECLSKHLPVQVGKDGMPVWLFCRYLLVNPEVWQIPTVNIAPGHLTFDNGRCGWSEGRELSVGSGAMLLEIAVNQLAYLGPVDLTGLR